jgi:uncharacterized RDD family membrane protein YckC
LAFKFGFSWHVNCNLQPDKPWFLISIKLSLPVQSTQSHLNVIPYRIAPPYKRLLAALIDILLIVPLITVSILITNWVLALPVTPDFTNFGLEIRMDEWAERHFWQIVILYSSVKLIIVSFYYILFEASKWQGTPGKRLMKIRVTCLESGRISLKRSAIRFFSKILSAQLMLGYLLILITHHKQGLHDLIAKTLVQENDMDQ